MLDYSARTLIAQSTETDNDQHHNSCWSSDQQLTTPMQSEDDAATSPSSTFRGIPWHSCDKPWHKRPFPCHQGLLRRQRHTRHSTWHSTSQRDPRVRSVGHTTRNTSGSTLRNPRTDSCTWHAPSSHQRRVSRSDGSTHCTAPRNPRSSRRTSSGERRADCHPKTQNRSQRAGRRRWYSMTSFDSSWSWSFVSQHAGHSRKRQASVHHWSCEPVISIGPSSFILESL